MAAPGADRVRRWPQQRAGPSPIIAAADAISAATHGPLLPTSPTPMVSRMKMRPARTAAAGKSSNRVRLTCSAKRRIASGIAPPPQLGPLGLPPSPSPPLASPARGDGLAADVRNKALETGGHRATPDLAPAAGS